MSPINNFDSLWLNGHRDIKVTRLGKFVTVFDRQRMPVKRFTATDRQWSTIRQNFDTKGWTKKSLR